MKNTAPIGLGICVVAGLFGFIGGAVSFVMYDWSFLGALFLALIIAIIVAIILMLGWREPAAAPVQAGSAGVGAGTAPTADVSDAGSKNTATSSDGTSDAAASSIAAASSATDEPKVKGSSTLAGEDELASRKGEWSYDGDKAETEAPAKAAPAPKKPAAKKPAAKKSAAKAAAKPRVAKASADDKDYDGDGVIEGENEGEKPQMLTAARDGGADNLKEIKGVGPKMENMLNDMGVYHFDQVAGWSAQEVAWVDANLKGFKGRVSRDGWVDQAKILAAGGDTEFSKKVEKGGVY